MTEEKKPENINECTINLDQGTVYIKSNTEPFEKVVSTARSIAANMKNWNGEHSFKG